MTVSKQDMQQLMYVFSHDLRNPLVNMRALIQDIQMSVSDAGDDIAALQAVVRNDLPDDLAMMEDVVQRMNALIAGANDIYHCMFDDLECEAVDVEALCEQSFHQLKQAYNDKHVTLDMACLNSIWVDPLALRKILAEVISNAIQFSRSDGKIDVCMEQQGDMDVLFIADAGEGIGEGDVERVFQPFFSTQGRAGMGLAVVQALVKAHGGKIWCTSEVGVGSTVYMAFPHKG